MNDLFNTVHWQNSHLITIALLFFPTQWTIEKKWRKGSFDCVDPQDNKIGVVGEVWGLGRKIDTDNGPYLSGDYREIPEEFISLHLSGRDNFAVAHNTDHCPILNHSYFLVT